MTRSSWTKERDNLAALAASLPPGPHPFAVGNRTFIDETVAGTRDWDQVPSLLMVLANLPQADAVEVVEADARILRQSLSRTRPWSMSTALGHIFELSIKARIEESFPGHFEFDVRMGQASDRNCDVRVELAGHPLNLECTTLHTSKEDVTRWEEYFLMKAEADRFAKEPEPFVVTDNGNGYAGARRFLGKVFEKLCAGGDARRSQLSEHEANVLALGFTSPISLSPRDHMLHEAMKELFRPQPSAESLRQWPAEMCMVESMSLCGFLTGALSYMQSQGKMLVPMSPELVPELMQLPRKIGAVLLFDQVELWGVYLNPNAHGANALRPGQVDVLKAALGKRCAWLPF